MQAQNLSEVSHRNRLLHHLTRRETYPRSLPAACLQPTLFAPQHLPMRKLFPSLGLPRNVVILGFSSDGKYLVSLTGSDFQLHTLQFTSNGAILKKIAQFDSCGEVDILSNTMELIWNRNSEDLYVVIIRHIWPSSCRRVVIHHYGKSTSIPGIQLVAGENCVVDNIDSNSHSSAYRHPVSSSCMILTTSSAELFFIRSASSPSSSSSSSSSTSSTTTTAAAATTTTTTTTTASMEALSAAVNKKYLCKSLSTFTAKHACRAGWWWCNTRLGQCGCMHCMRSSSDLYDGLEVVVIDGTQLSSMLMKTFYKDLVIPADILDMEIRFIGLNEQHTEYMVVLTIIIKYNSSQKVLLVKTALNPWKGTIQVVNISDFQNFLDSHQEGFRLYIANGQNVGAPKLSWLQQALAFYVSFVKDNLSCLQSNSEVIVSNIGELLFNSQLASVQSIRHPTLPIVVVFDEGNEEDFIDETF